MTNIWTIFGRQSISGIFWTTFLAIIGLRIGQDLRNVQILHLQLGPLSLLPQAARRQPLNLLTDGTVCKNPISSQQYSIALPAICS